jgi:hypothetical protein
MNKIHHFIFIPVTSALSEGFALICFYFLNFKCAETLKEIMMKTHKPFSWIINC